MNKTRRKTGKKSLSGFTLVELIVVIAILGILAGVAYPVYTGYIKRANSAKVLNTLSYILTTCESAAETVGEDVDTINIYVSIKSPISGGRSGHFINVNNSDSNIHRDKYYANGTTPEDKKIYEEYLNSVEQLSGGKISAEAVNNKLGLYISEEEAPELALDNLQDTSYYDLYGNATKYLRWTKEGGWTTADKP